MKNILLVILNVCLSITVFGQSITLNQPNGGNSLSAGSNQSISWTSSGITDVNIEFSSNNGSSWSTVANNVSASSGSYSWTVPSVNSTLCKIKVYDAGNASTSDVSNNVFSISIPTLTLNTPNGGENWIANTYQYIYWVSSGMSSYPYIDIDYSTDGGTAWTSVATYINTSNNSYYWYIPNTPSTTCKIRIKDTYTNTIIDESDVNFKISAPSPTLALTDPTGGEQWTAGSTQYIYWSSTGLSTVKLEYTTNNGASWVLIDAAATASQGYYTWSVPMVSSSLCKIKVSDPSNSSLVDISDNVFSIVTTGLTITSPNGGESYGSGTSQTIYWNTTGSITYVNLEYSLDNGANWTTYISGTYNYGYYSWTVPSAVSSNCLVRVSDYYNPSTINDVSNAVFTINAAIPSFAITNPYGGEVYIVGESEYIYWNQTNGTNVKLEYSIDNGATWNLITASTPASIGYYYWTIPNTPGTQGKIRISDVNNAGYYDISDNHFTISNPYITVMNPNGGESWNVGASKYIEWNYGGTGAYVTIEVSYNGGSTYTTIVSGASNSGSYYWNVTGTPSNTCKIRISDYYTPSIVDASNQNFAIVASGSPTLEVYDPNGSEVYSVGSGQYINWYTTGVSNVKIEYSINNGSTWTTLAASVPASNQSYYWNPIPATISDDCRVRISDVSNSLYADVSDATFKIVTPSLTVNSPNGGEVWTALSYHNITWNSENAGSYVNIYYSTDNGSTWNWVSNGTYNSGSYNWYVPNSPSTTCLIKVEDYYTNATYDVSDATFTIGTPPPTITLSTPNGGEVWIAGSTQTIYWSAANVTNLKVQYSLDNGASWSTITASTPASNGFYNWALPTTTSGLCKVKLSDASDTSFFDMSNTTFSIVQSGITVITPNGGEVYTGGTNQYVYWTSAGISSYVDIHISTDNGSSWTSIVNGAYNSGSYYYTVPNISSTNCLIRVRDYYTNTTLDSSDATFTINAAPATITVTSPNGGESWTAGNGYYIYWNSSNTSNVKIDYSLNNGASWSPVIASTSASSGSYYWTTPVVQSNQCKIKISDVADTTYFDLSNNVFSINTPGFTVVTPNGGEVWTGGSNEYMYWSTTGSVSYVNIHLSTDSGSTYNLIANGISNNGQYYWNVTNTPSDKCLVKISDYYNSSVNDVSDSTFTINPAVPTLTLTTPNGGQNWYVGTSQYIYWSSAYVNNVKLEYSIDNGSSWNVIVASTAASSQSYYWTIPSIGTQAAACSSLVRVTDVSDSTLTDISNSTFCITNPYITITTPNGGESWTGGTSQYIYWNYGGISSYVNIEYSINNGSSWTTIANGTYNYGYYYWPVPNSFSSCALIRVSDYYNSVIYDQTDSCFQITSSNPFITVSDPNGGETFGVATSEYIQWSSQFVTNVNIEYSVNGGSTWNTVVSNISAANGYYLWTVPNSPSVNCLVKISDASNSSINDQSNSAFTIATPSITVTYPNGGQTFTGGTSQNITWTSTGTSGYVNIDYSLNNGASWNAVAASVYNSGSYSWTVPNTPSTNCKIRVTDYYNGSINDASNNVFTILAAPPQITVNSPNGGEVLATGGTYNITWSSVSVNFVRIEFSSNGGSSWAVVNPSVSASLGSYNWPVSPTPSQMCLVKISDASNLSINDISNNYFEINTPSIVVTDPNGGEIFTGLTYEYITWTSSAASSYVSIDYSINNGSSWSQVTNGAFNNGSYYWLVPNTPSGTCRVRVRDYYNSTISDISNNTFEINAAPASVVLTSPNGGEVWGTGSSKYITWSSSAITNVKIEYSVNGGSSYSTIVASTPASNGYYLWPVPSNPSTNCYVRISDASNSSVSDESNSSFTITTPSFVITDPNGGETWTGNTYQNITWNNNGVSSYVKIEYTLNGGTQWNTISNGAYNSGSYNWYVPNTPSTQCLVRVSDYYTGSISDVSNNYFTILQAPPSITLTSPNGGENFAVGTSQYIYWNSSSVSNVKLEYSSNGGGSWNTIIATTPNNGSYLWPVPNAVSSQCLVRVSDVANPGVADISNSVFSIQSPFISINYPNGGEMLQVGNSYYVTWTSNGVSNVKVEFTTNNGSSWSVLASNIYNYGYYYWTIPNTLSANCKVRVSSIGAVTATDMSNNVFSIVASTPAISLNSPNGGEYWYSGSQYYIYWSANAVNNVKLELSINGGTSWSTIVASTNATSGFYYWTAPNTPSTTCRMRITDLASGAVSDMSDADFTIATPVPSLTVNSPNGGETWIEGTYKYINWTSNFVNAVNLSYSTDSGSTWMPLANNFTGNWYYWNVPSTTSTMCYVKVVSSIDPAVKDSSDLDFTIAPYVPNTNTIATDSIVPFTFCKEDTIKVYYNASGTYNSGNTFTAQLSDSSGSFSNPLAIGSVVGTSSGFINSIVPATVLNGQGYRIRVVSDDLPAVGSDNGADIFVNSPEFDFAVNSNDLIKYLPDGQVTFTYLGDTTNMSSYEWTFGDGGTSLITNPVYNYMDIGFMDVSLTVTNDNGCAISLTKNAYIRVERLFTNTTLSTGTTADITGLSFKSDSVGCITTEDGYCIVTNDNGTSWSPYYTNNNGAPLTSATWVTGAGVYVTGPSGFISHSSDNGVTWSPFVTGTNETFNSVSVLNSSLGYAVGTNGTVFTYNGSAWSGAASGTSRNLNDVVAVNNTLAFAVGDSGKVIKTSDGGTTWNPETTGINADLISAHFVNSTKGYAVGKGGAIISYTSGTWSVEISGLDVDFTGVGASVTGDTVWAFGSSGIIYRNIGNTSWERFSKGSTNDNTGGTYRTSRGYIIGKGGDARVYDSGEVDTTVGIATINVVDMFNVYPNPAAEKVLIKGYSNGVEGLQIEVRDMNGRKISVIANEEVNGDYQFSYEVNSLRPAVYFIHVNQGTKSWVHKLVVVH